MSLNPLSLYPVAGMPLVQPGDDIDSLIHAAIQHNDLQLLDNDILVIAQKIVSKSENRLVCLDSIEPGDEALEIAQTVQKDPRLVELILRESVEIVRCKPGVIIVEHHSGTVMANAGIDHSNVGENGAGEYVTLLPRDSNESARAIARQLEQLCGLQLGILIIDSVGRAWRNGTVGLCLGCANVTALRDLRGHRDIFGKVLEVSESADADALASAACLVMGEGSDSVPVVLVRGHAVNRDDRGQAALVREKHEDLFR